MGGHPDLTFRPVADDDLSRWLHELRSASPTYVAWIAVCVRREQAFVIGACTRCAAQWPPEQRQAVYVWVWAERLITEERLCEECCAWMRQRYTPRRVATLSG